MAEALNARQRATVALYDPALLSRTEAGAALAQRLSGWAERSYEVDGRILHAAAATETPAGVVAVLRYPDPPPLEAHGAGRFGLILDRLSDPGNAGTILRTADATGVGYVVALPGSVDLFAPKVVRAGMGAHFRLAVYRGISWSGLAAELPDVSWVGIDAAGERSLCGFSWPERSGLVVGGEAHGLSPEVRGGIHTCLRIPMRFGVESLNAAVAASLALYAALGPRISAG
ncbi:MAG: RNA methyltransferase [Chloroflexi bacterium]|nr:RNA methyltransferase [Chloroflexota bacterium]